MTNKKTTKLSEEQKEEIKEIVGMNQGAYDVVEIIPQTTQSEQTFNEIVKALKNGKYYVMRLGFSRNSVYNLIKKLRENAQIEACFGETKTGEKDGKAIMQFAIWKKKD